MTTIYLGIPDSRSPQRGEIDSWLVRLLPGLLNKQIGITAQSNLYEHKGRLKKTEKYKGRPQLKKSLKLQLLAPPPPPLRKRALPTKTSVFLT